MILIRLNSLQNYIQKASVSNIIRFRIDGDSFSSHRAFSVSRYALTLISALNGLNISPFDEGEMLRLVKCAICQCTLIREHQVIEMCAARLPIKTHLQVVFLV